MGKIFCFIGKSSSGKDTIFSIVSKDLININKIVPFTTRPIREGETNGKEYYFVNEEEFKKMINNNLVIEFRKYNTIHGIWIYFTASKNIDLENNNYMIINTLEGYNNLKNYYGEDIVIPIYIEVENGVRLTRALEREKMQEFPKYEEMCRRFLKDQEDFSEEKIITSGINKRFVNNDLLECVLEIETEILKYLDKEKQYRI